MLALFGYVLIGLFTGIIAKLIMPVKVPDGVVSLGCVGIIGAMIGGLGVMLLFGYGRSYDYLYGYTVVADANQANASGLPAYWMTYLTALLGALLALSIYKIIRVKRLDI